MILILFYIPAKTGCFWRTSLSGIRRFLCSSSLLQTKLFWTLTIIFWKVVNLTKLPASVDDFEVSMVIGLCLLNARLPEFYLLALEYVAFIDPVGPCLGLIPGGGYKNDCGAFRKKCPADVYLLTEVVFSNFLLSGKFSLQTILSFISKINLELWNSIWYLLNEFTLNSKLVWSSINDISFRTDWSFSLICSFLPREIQILKNCWSNNVRVISFLKSVSSWKLPCSFITKVIYCFFLSNLWSSLWRTS